jgi:hypothetical protein
MASSITHSKGACVVGIGSRGSHGEPIRFVASLVMGEPWEESFHGLVLADVYTNGEGNDLHVIAVPDTSGHVPLQGAQSLSTTWSPRRIGSLDPEPKPGLGSASVRRTFHENPDSP